MIGSLKNILGNSNARVIKKMQSVIDDINDFSPDIARLNDNELRSKTIEFKDRISKGETTNDLLPEAFAVVREAAERTIGLRHFDVQLIGGVVLYQGKISEMRTGEGKTLVATLPAYLESLEGKGVHIVTVNDYLARRDCQWMGAVFDFLGVSVSSLQHASAYQFEMGIDDAEFDNLRPISRSDAYKCDIVYGTNNEFGFDYLRDNMVQDIDEKVQRGRSYAIVDEVDNILIDEARTPLIISGPAEESSQEYSKFSKIVSFLRSEKDYTIDEKHRTVGLTVEGVQSLEDILKIDNLYSADNYKNVHFIENALKAKAIFQRDRDYVLRDRQVVIVDEFTGRLMEGRRFADGLHQALEAKENVPIKRESVTYATITLQNYFRLYEKLSGMTGTAVTEAEEFFKIYNLDVIEVPTFKPMIRQDKNDLVFKSQKVKYQAAVDHIFDIHQTGQPILVGTTDIDKSELVSKMLKKKGIKHEVLNAKNHEREAQIIAQAGSLNAVTVATNMAGRGTDIILGGNPESFNDSLEHWQQNHEQVVSLGGLYVVGTDRHEARRIDNQLRGRSGRQGDPGSTQFFGALDDELLRRFGGERLQGFMNWAGQQDDEAIDNKMIEKFIRSAQIKVEGFNFDIRKHLVDYDDVVNTHRDVIYNEREKVLDGMNLSSNIKGMVNEEISAIIEDYLSNVVVMNWDIDGMLKEIEGIVPIPESMYSQERVSGMTSQTIEKSLLEHVDDLYDSYEDSPDSNLIRHLEKNVMLSSIDRNWVQHLTYMGNLRQGIGLQAYGQRDPLVMYKKEGHDAFQKLQARITDDIVHSVFANFSNVLSISPPASQNLRNDNISTQSTDLKPSNSNQNLTKDSSAFTALQPNGVQPKIGRNQTCPCGSGKKYKRCHGSN